MSVSIPIVDETVTVTVGVLGAAESALGTAHVRVEIDPTADGAESARAVGEAMSAAYMDALADAMREFHPTMIEHFRDQRLRADDPSVE